MKAKRKPPYYIVVIFACILGIPIVFYYSVFHRFGISKLSTDWSNFGSYLNVFVSLCNVAIFTTLTIKLYGYNETRDIVNDKFQRSIQQPVLILKSSIENSKELWSIENIGNGPAVNMRVMEAWERPQWKLPMTKCYSLGKDKTFPLQWFEYANIICVIYEDIFGGKYVTIGADDESHVRALDESFYSIEVDNSTFNRLDIEKFWLLPQQRWHQAMKNFSSTTIVQ